MPANPSFLSIYLLNNALSKLLLLGNDAIEKHALALTEKLWLGAESMGWELMTPGDQQQRAGNVCIMTDRVDQVAAALREKNILIWGTYAGDTRLRISAHVITTLMILKPALMFVRGGLTYRLVKNSRSVPRRC